MKILLSGFHIFPLFFIGIQSSVFWQKSFLSLYTETFTNIGLFDTSLQIFNFTRHASDMLGVNCQAHCHHLKFKCLNLFLSQSMFFNQNCRWGSDLDESCKSCHPYFLPNWHLKGLCAVKPGEKEIESLWKTWNFISL